MDARHPKRRPTGLIVAILTLTAAVWPAGPLFGAGGKLRIPVLFQATRNTEGQVWYPRVKSEQGSSIVFVSDGDVEGPGSAAGHREVYLYDTAARTIHRITHTSAGESYQASRETDDTHSKRPRYVVFVSTGDLDVRADNSDGNPEIFLWRRDTGAIQQITDTHPPVVNAQPYASDSGKCIAFRSNADLDNNDGSDSGNPGAGFRNPDGSDEVFVLDFLDASLSGTRITQVSNGPSGTTSGNPVIGGFWFTRQCRSTTYSSNFDQLGNGSTGTHLYNYTRNSARTEQISPPGTGANSAAAISSASNFARGPFVPFTSDSDPTGNGSVGEVYRFRLFKTEIVEFSWGGGTGVTRHPAISDGGGYMVAETTAELVDPGRRVRGDATPPFNTDGNSEIVRLRGNRRIWPITRSANCENTDPTVRDNGRSIAFRSTCDLVAGGNPSLIPQVFFYTEVPVDSPLATATGCTTASGCCNEANGCYTPVQGRARRGPRPRKLRPQWNRGG